MSSSIVHTVRDKDITGRIYKDNEWEEYRVTLRKDGQRKALAVYHTPDKEDAYSTLTAMIKKIAQPVSLPTIHGLSVVNWETSIKQLSLSDVSIYLSSLHHLNQWFQWDLVFGSSTNLLELMLGVEYTARTSKK